MSNAEVFRSLVLLSTLYALSIAGVVLARLLCRTLDAEKVFHVVTLVLSWLFARVYIVVDTLDRWEEPTDGRFALALASNLWAILGLHILEQRQRRNPQC